MSITQTYYLAHKARGKLSREASQSDHDLRLLVGHANLLDSLMVELADAEREQERWFNQSVRGASSPAKNQERRVQWADQIVEAEDEYDSDSSSGSDSDSDFDDDEDVEMTSVPLLVPQPPSSPRPAQVQYHHMMDHDDDLEEDYAHLGLVRTNSRSNSPPELELDVESSEDESMPPSPPQPALPSFSEKNISEVHAVETSSQEDGFYDQSFYVPSRNQARLVTNISVY